LLDFSAHLGDTLRVGAQVVVEQGQEGGNEGARTLPPTEWLEAIRQTLHHTAQLCRGTQVRFVLVAPRLAEVVFGSQALAAVFLKELEGVVPAIQSVGDAGLARQTEPLAGLQTRGAVTCRQPLAHGSQ
jgi:hypothetical protein